LSWDYYPDRFRRRRRRFPFFSEDFFGDIDRMMEDMFRGMQESMPKSLLREEKLPDGSIVRRMGPFVYGYSMSIGPDGKPVIREFGNVKHSMKPTAFGEPRPSFDVKEKQEPFVDIIEEKDALKVVAEVPGVEKEDIDLKATENSLTISVDTKTRRYYKEVEFPSNVDPESVNATYRNGVLEVTLTKGETKLKGRRIKIE
jgi:HSP20 family protein